MNEKSTSFTKNSIKNATFTLCFEFVNLVLMFIARFLFLKQLSVEILAVDSMMKTILGYVAFADLGITSIMTFFLFAPIKDNNYTKIRTILSFYKYVYYGIVGLTLVLGIIFPFLFPILLDSSVEVSYNIYIIYSLFVLNLVLSYLFASDRTFLIADQRSYVVNGSILTFQIVQVLLQIVFLLLFKNYYLYLIIPCLATVFGRFYIYLYKKKKYPELLEKKCEALPKKERKEFYKKIGDVVFFRIGTLLFNFSDNIIISIMLSTVLVGYVSNYVLIVSAANTILMSAINSLIGTIGAISTQKNKKDSYLKFLKMDEAVFIIFLFVSLCLFGVATPFVNWVFGSKYVMSTEIVFALVLSFFITGINQVTSLFRSSFGLFKEARWIPLACGLVNIGLSVLLGHFFGLFGIYLATSIAKVFTFNLFDLILVHSKKGFCQRISKRLYLVIAKILIVVLSLFVLKELVLLAQQFNGGLYFIISTALSLSLSIVVCLTYFSCSSILQKAFIDNIIPFLKGAREHVKFKKAKRAN